MTTPGSRKATRGRYGLAAAALALILVFLVVSRTDSMPEASTAVRVQIGILALVAVTATVIGRPYSWWIAAGVGLWFGPWFSVWFNFYDGDPVRLSPILLAGMAIYAFSGFVGGVNLLQKTRPAPTVSAEPTEATDPAVPTTELSTTTEPAEPPERAQSDAITQATPTPET